jgi:hypothetical protein
MGSFQFDFEINSERAVILHQVGGHLREDQNDARLKQRQSIALVKYFRVEDRVKGGRKALGDRFHCIQSERPNFTDER